MDHESFSEFKNSFSYGYRSDLSFKFLKGLPDEEAAVFIQTLFTKIVEAMDSGNWQPVAEHVIAGQVASYSKPGSFAYDDAPFTPLPKPLNQLKLGLLTSSGHFVAGGDPRPFGEENMTQLEATVRISDFLREAPTLSAIPMDTPPVALRVRHGGYDIRGAEADPNVILPLAHLQTLAKDGIVGALAENAYSFVGACAQTPLRKKSAPQWAAMLKQQGIEAMVLLPA
ncbi:glycine/sarcosine/betaine reductase selenoprotein B family protein [Candidatus Leptofilum sp.]|uniref:glycine/sarcosine/betaine reductase selenoprotein B family protein n=1 Tax=Candidatus Leptofilum sp. TaxID=3241576 RepID=UPI003B5B672E